MSAPQFAQKRAPCSKGDAHDGQRSVDMSELGQVPREVTVQAMRNQEQLACHSRWLPAISANHRSLVTNRERRGEMPVWRTVAD
jgi:hypothetical protein